MSKNLTSEILPQTQYIVFLHIMQMAPFLPGAFCADLLPSASYSLATYTCLQPANCSPEATAQGLGTFDSLRQGSIFGGPYASANVYGPFPEADAGAYGDAYASATLTYYFELSGPAGALVPINVTGAYQDSGGGGERIGSISIFGLPFISGNCCYDQSFYLDNVQNFGGPAVTGSHNYGLPVISDTVYKISLFAYAFQGDYCDNNTSAPPPQNCPSPADVNIDPTISIDSTFSGIDQFQLLLSPGITNSPGQTSVPAPDGLALLGVGLAGLIAQRRRLAVRN